jgi:hypothetical protein
MIINFLVPNRTVYWALPCGRLFAGLSFRYRLFTTCGSREASEWADGDNRTLFSLCFSEPHAKGSSVGAAQFWHRLLFGRFRSRPNRSCWTIASTEWQIYLSASLESVGHTASPRVSRSGVCNAGTSAASLAHHRTTQLWMMRTLIPFFIPVTFDIRECLRCAFTPKHIRAEMT